MLEPGRKPRAEDEYSGVRIDRKRLQQLQEIAQREDRSVASVLRRFVDEGVEREEATA